MEQWLRYLQWYWTTGVDDWVTIEMMLDAPPVRTNWKITNEDQVLTHFGFLLLLYGKVSALGLDWMPPILPSYQVLLGASRWQERADIIGSSSRPDPASLSYCTLSATLRATRRTSL